MPLVILAFLAVAAAGAAVFVVANQEPPPAPTVDPALFGDVLGGVEAPGAPVRSASGAIAPAAGGIGLSIGGLFGVQVPEWLARDLHNTVYREPARAINDTREFFTNDVFGISGKSRERHAKYALAVVQATDGAIDMLTRWWGHATQEGVLLWDASDPIGLRILSTVTTTPREWRDLGQPGPEGSNARWFLVQPQLWGTTQWNEAVRVEWSIRTNGIAGHFQGTRLEGAFPRLDREGFTSDNYAVPREQRAAALAKIEDAHEAELANAATLARVTAARGLRPGQA